MNGLLIPMDEPERFATSLQTLCDDASLRLRLGASGRDVLQRFADAAVLPRWTAAIEEAVR